MKPYFHDPDGDQLRYSTRTSPAGRVTASVSGDTVVIAPLSAGTATVTVTAQDPGSLRAEQRISVTVNPKPPPPPDPPDPPQPDPNPGDSRVFNGITFVWIPPGNFSMGSTSRHSFPNEQPVTRVTISRGFWLGKYEVTQDQWQAVMGNNPSTFSGCGSCPVENITWDTMQAFIRRLNARAGGQRYRLPTEAEWEYAARAGTSTDTYAGNLTQPDGNDPVLNRIAWYDRNSGGRTQRVGQKTPNRFGLYDMLGNVWERVWDRYQEYPGGSVTDPTGPTSGSELVVRGGGWLHSAVTCRSSHRGLGAPDARASSLGFRLLRRRSTPSVANRPPETIVRTHHVTLQVGGSTKSVSVGDFFRDPDGDRLTYSTRTTPAGKVTARVSGDAVLLTPVAAGTARVTVTARDPGNLTTTMDINVTVNSASTQPEDPPDDPPGDPPSQDPNPGTTRVFDGITFVWVPPGDFQMGSTSQHAEDHEQPVTRVTISRGFWLSKHEVTQAQWKNVMGGNPSWFKSCGGDCPVEQVSWFDALAFIGKLNDGSGGEPYRLPTEAEWEYAARAGTQTDTPAGDLRILGSNNAPVLDRIAWYGGNSGVTYADGRDCSDWVDKQYPSDLCGTHPVGRKAANAWGLHDMLGNVFEWVWDRYGDYPGGSVTDPEGPGSGLPRVVRGGSWANFASFCRSAFRVEILPLRTARNVGFRVVRTE